MTEFFQVESLSKDFGGVRAVKDLNLSLGEGELLCILGPNGCGKTTLFNLISGALTPTSGRVFFNGRDITRLRPNQISELGIGRKFQVPGIYPEHTVFENIEVPLFAKAGRSSFRGMFRQPDLDDRARSLLSQIGLESKSHVEAGKLSHGQKQWLEIGMVLASAPRLILLDEPTAGMTVGETQATVKLIRQIVSESNISLIVIEHDISFVRELDCPIMVMLKGTASCQGSYAEIRKDPQVRRVYLGRKA